MMSDILKPTRRQLLSAVATSTMVTAAGCGKRELLPIPEIRFTPPFRDLLPKWSPDGTRIAYLRASATGWACLMMADAELGSPTPVTLPEPLFVNSPPRTSRVGWLSPWSLSWCADGKSLLYPRLEWFPVDEHQKLAGAGVYRWYSTKDPAVSVAIHSQPYPGVLRIFRNGALSGSMQHIAFVGESLEGHTALYLVHQKEWGQIAAYPRFDAYLDCDWPTWSPDGRVLLYRQGIQRTMTSERIESLRLIEPGGTQSGSVCVISAADTRQLLNLNGAFAVQSRATHPSFSRDGKGIAFSLTGSPQDRMSYGIISWRGDLVRRSPVDGTGYHAPVFIDADTIGALRFDQGHVTAIALPSGRRRAIALCDLPGSDVDWSPDRKTLVVAGEEGLQVLKTDAGA